MNGEYFTLFIYFIVLFCSILNLKALVLLQNKHYSPTRGLESDKHMLKGFLKGMMEHFL